MDVRPRRALLATLALLVVGSVLMPAVLADTHDYRISVDGSVPIPEQTKRIDESGVEGEFTFDAIKAADPGEEFTARVDGVPSGEGYNLRVSRFTDGGELRIQRSYAMTGNDETTVEAPDTPGVYFLSANTDNYESLYPFIVQEYDVDVDWGTVPDAAEVGSEVSVSAEITRSANPAERQQIKYVDVVIANEETLHNETLRPTEESKRSFTVSGSITVEETSLTPSGGPYALYVAARGPDTLEGLRIPVGISEQRAFEVTEPTTSTPTPSTTLTPTATSTRTPTDPVTPTSPPESSTQTATVPETPTTTDDTGTLPTLRPRNGTLVPGDNTTPTETGGIITPGAPETGGTDEETVTGGQPGFIVLATLLVLLFVAVLYRSG
jgi:hypothetical protein